MMHPRAPTAEPFSLYRLAHPGDEPAGTIWGPDVPRFKVGVDIFMTIVQPFQLSANISESEVETLARLSEDPHRISTESLAEAQAAVVLQLPEPYSTEWLVISTDGSDEWVYIGGRRALEWQTARLPQ